MEVGGAQGVNGRLGREQGTKAVAGRQRTSWAGGDHWGSVLLNLLAALIFFFSFFTRVPVQPSHVRARSEGPQPGALLSLLCHLISLVLHKKRGESGKWCGLVTWAQFGPAVKSARGSHSLSHYCKWYLHDCRGTAVRLWRQGKQDVVDKDGGQEEIVQEAVVLKRRGWIVLGVSQMKGGDP